jgi:hypothetical protein
VPRSVPDNRKDITAVGRSQELAREHALLPSTCTSPRRAEPDVSWSSLSVLTATDRAHDTVPATLQTILQATYSIRGDWSSLRPCFRSHREPTVLNMPSQNSSVVRGSIVANKVDPGQSGRRQTEKKES